MSKSEIKINGTTMRGVCPGKGFYDTLRAPLEAKDYIFNESRLEDGVRVLSTPIKYKKRSMVLEFLIKGVSSSQLQTNMSLFLYALSHPSNGVPTVALTITGIDHTFNVIYTGKSPSYSGGLSGCACKIKIGLDEPIPTPLD